MSSFRGVGRHRQGPDTSEPFSGANPLFGYVGTDDGNAIDLGLGVLNSPHLNALQATGRLGGWNTENGFQIGAQGQASLFEVGGSLGDVVGMFGGEVTDATQGGWENFLSVEGHGPKAQADAHMGTDGVFVGAGAEVLGGSAKIGGAEYDWFGGTEISVGGGFGGVGANGGVHWSDDDGDGIRELGLSLGGAWGVGVDLGVKTELLGHAINGVSSAWDWLTGD